MCFNIAAVSPCTWLAASKMPLWHGLGVKDGRRELLQGRSVGLPVSFSELKRADECRLGGPRPTFERRMPRQGAATSGGWEIPPAKTSDLLTYRRSRVYRAFDSNRCFLPLSRCRLTLPAFQASLQPSTPKPCCSSPARHTSRDLRFSNLKQNTALRRVFAAMSSAYRLESVSFWP